MVSCVKHSRGSASRILYSHLCTEHIINISTVYEYLSTMKYMLKIKEQEWSLNENSLALTKSFRIV